MAISVVLHCDFDVLPAHVQIRDRVTEFIAHRDLRLWPRQSSLHQNQAQPCLLGRLRPSIEQSERMARACDPATSRVPLSQQLYISRFEFRRASQRIDGSDRARGWVPATEIEHCPGHRSHWNAADDGDLFVRDAVPASMNARQPVAVLMDQLDGRRTVDPLTTVQGGRRQSRDDSSAFRPEPSSLRAQCGRYLYIPIDIDIAEQPYVAGSKLTSAQRSICNGLATKERLSHRRSVACHGADVTSPAEREVSFTSAGRFIRSMQRLQVWRLRCLVDIRSRGRFGGSFLTGCVVGGRSRWRHAIWGCFATLRGSGGSMLER